MRRLILKLLIGVIAAFFVFIGVRFLPVKADDQHIVISEVYYDVDSSHGSTEPDYEWVEIYNASGSSINLENWNIGDNKTTRTITSDYLLFDPGEYLLISKTNDTWTFWGIDPNSPPKGVQIIALANPIGNGLSNSGDELTLSDNASKPIDQMSYGTDTTFFNLAIKNTPGQSIARINPDIDIDSSADWDSKATPTPGSGYKPAEIDNDTIGNITLEDQTVNEIQLISIADARGKSDGEEVRVEGTVTVEPGKLSSQYFYIQDSTGGIQIYCYKKNFPTIEPGDRVSVTGELGSYNQDRRIKISDASDIVILGHESDIAPASVTIDEINDNLVGQVVAFEGTVTATSGSTFYLHGSGEIKVVIHESTNIDKPRMRRGDLVAIVGIVVKNKDTLEVLPFYQEGVKILTSGVLPGAGRGPVKSSDIWTKFIQWLVLALKA